MGFILFFEFLRSPKNSVKVAIVSIWQKKKLFSRYLSDVPVSVEGPIFRQIGIHFFPWFHRSCLEEKLGCSSIETLTGEFAGDFPDERPTWQSWSPRQSGDSHQIAKNWHVPHAQREKIV